MQRWTLHDPVAADTWQMRNNPRQMSSPVRGQRTTTGRIRGVVRALRAPQMPMSWTFNGRLHRKEDYDALEEWAGRPNAIEITDHLGRVHRVVPQSFDPVPVEKSGVGNPWLFDYTFTALYLKRLP